MHFLLQVVGAGVELGLKKILEAETSGPQSPAQSPAPSSQGTLAKETSGDPKRVQAKLT